MNGHGEVIRRQFAKQAQGFEDPSYSFADPRVLEWIVPSLPLTDDACVLDVAAGTGQLARAVAPSVRHVVAVDLTPEMLQLGHGQAERAGLGNILFERGDAAALPYVEASFDLVVSRFAIHHFSRPEAAIDEMARVCRPGGFVAAMDMVAAEPELAQRYNEIERWRDPSHASALGEEELRALFDAAGLRLVSTELRDQAVSVERWLAQTRADAEIAGRVRAVLTAELEGGPPTGMRPIARGDELLYQQRWVMLVARRSS